MLKNVLIKCLILFIFCCKSQSFQVTYGFPNVDPTTGTSDPGPFPQAAGLQFGAFLAEGVSLAPSASGRFSFTSWPLGAFNGDDDIQNLTGNLSPFSFYAFTIRVNMGYTLSLNSLEFSVRRSGTGPRTYALRSSQDNYTFNLSASTGTNSRLSVIPTNVFLWNYDSISTSSDQYGSLVNLESALQEITDSVTFHFYAWNAESPGGSFSVDNVKIRGSISDSSQVETFLSDRPQSEPIKIYPNPVSGDEIILEGILPDSVECEDLSRGDIYRCPVLTENRMSILKISALHPGAFILKIKSGAQVYYRKIVKE